MTRLSFVFKFIVFSTLVLSVITTNGQAITDNEFGHFANRQDSLYRKAYEKKNILTYHSLLNEFDSKYRQLNVAEKKTYASYYINAYYNLSCIYALTGNRKMALDYLQKSIESGYYNYAHIQQDSDFHAIRNDSQFKRLVEPLREIGDYLYILKKARNYNVADNRTVPAFTYQSADNLNLAALRKAFNLDYIAGTGNEVSRILNLLHWIHNLIPHDGNHNNPDIKNAVNMIAVCKKEGRGLNCRGLATVLNECYLALGFKSRMVTCYPKDSLGIDPDCHVINMVYTNTLKKWIWIDPTFEAYVMNEQGQLLSIEEVRERIINDKPLIINPDTNWNRKLSQTKASYLYQYMAKNLYRLECPVSSEYNLETGEEGKTIQYIELLPLNYFRQIPDRKEMKRGNTTFTVFKTNNPTLFW